MIFPEVCHSCGLCCMVCPAHAVSEIDQPIGTMEIGMHEETKVVTGILNPGEASGVPVIRAVLKQAEGLTVLDCPPGSACSVMESIMDADYCVLVTEPTAFGFHNFQMVYELTTLLKKNCGVVINKQAVPYEPLDAFCMQHNLPVLARIPYHEDLAARIANGEILAETVPEEKERFQDLLRRIGGAV